MRRCCRRGTRDRQPRPDHPAPAARDASLHAADRGSQPHRRAHGYRCGGRLPAPRPGRRRRGGAAGAGLSCRGLRRAGRGPRRGQHRRHCQHHHAGRGWRRRRVRHRAWQLPDGPVGRGAPGCALRSRWRAGRARARAHSAAGDAAGRTLSGPVRAEEHRPRTVPSRLAGASAAAARGGSGRRDGDAVRIHRAHHRRCAARCAGIRPAGAAGLWRWRPQRRTDAPARRAVAGIARGRYFRARHCAGACRGGAVCLAGRAPSAGLARQHRRSDRRARAACARCAPQGGCHRTVRSMSDARGSRMDSLINRELSLLEFNQRVLALAEDESLPLLERLRFLCISSSNLDEFFEIRVAGLKQMEELGSVVAPLLTQSRSRTARPIEVKYRCLNAQLLPALHANAVRLQTRDTWNTEDRALLEAHFHNEVEPVLSPLGLDPARPFPRIQNKSLNFIVRLEGKDAFGRDTELAVVQVPRSLPRVVRVPNGASGVSLVLLSNIVAEFVPLLFPGMSVSGCYPFRVTRNSDLFVDEEEIDDLRRALEGELVHRRYGASVRLETSMDCPEDVADYLLAQFMLEREDLYRVPGPVNLNRLSVIYDLAARSDL